MPSRLQTLVTRAGKSENQLAAQISDAIVETRQQWAEAGKEATDYLLLVLGNNPGRSLDDVIEDNPEVLDALRIPFQETRVDTLAGLNWAWKVGLASGRKAGREDLGIIGVAPSDSTPAVPETYRDALASDIRKNTSAARSRYLKAVRESSSEELQERLDAITADLSRRAGIGLNSAAHKAHMDAKEAEYDASGVKAKVWVTRFRPTTCRTCARLHGTVIKVKAEFSHTAHWGPGKPPLVYGDLKGPPRHPHCGCRIVPWISNMTKDAGVGPAEMKSYAKAWLASIFGKAS